MLLMSFKRHKEKNNKYNLNSNKNTEEIPANTGEHGIVAQEGLARGLGWTKEWKKKGNI